MKSWILATLILCSCSDTIVQNFSGGRTKTILATGWGGLSEFEINQNVSWGPFNTNNLDSICIAFSLEIITTDTAGFGWWVGQGKPFYSCDDHLYGDTLAGVFSFTFPASAFYYPNEQIICLSVVHGIIRARDFSICGWEKN